MTGKRDEADLAKDAVPRTVLGDLSPRALPLVSRALAAIFGRSLLISTIHDGHRMDDTDEAERADLDALADALPPGRLSRALADCDAASNETAMVTAIRRGEGLPPRVPAVLCPQREDEIQTLLSEASAAGYEPVGGARRPIGLSFAALNEARREGDAYRIGAGTPWSALAALAQRGGASVPAEAVSGRYATPCEAVGAGLFFGAEPVWFRGEIIGAALDLPPETVGATDRTWSVPANAADGLLAVIARSHEPLYAETIAPTDLAVLAAGGLMASAGDGRAGLRVVAQGTRGVRAAMIREIGRRVRRAGGRVLHRGPLPSDADLVALAAAAGAARFDLKTPPSSLPPATVAFGRAVALRGQVRRTTALWYPRDLARSLDQADDLLSGPEPAEEIEGTAIRNDDGGWEALRAALRDALP